jgi:hypothetical protein
MVEMIIKQIAILATTCMAVSLLVAANIVPRAFSQESEDFEKKMQSFPITNATTKAKTSVFIVSCNVSVLPHTENKSAEKHCDWKRLIP